MTQNKKLYIARLGQHTGWVSGFPPPLGFKLIIYPVFNRFMTEYVKRYRVLSNAPKKAFFA